MPRLANCVCLPIILKKIIEIIVWIRCAKREMQPGLGHLPNLIMIRSCTFETIRQDLPKTVL